MSPPDVGSTLPKVNNAVYAERLARARKGNVVRLDSDPRSAVEGRAGADDQTPTAAKEAAAAAGGFPMLQLSPKKTSLRLIDEELDSTMLPKRDDNTIGEVALFAKVSNSPFIRPRASKEHYMKRPPVSELHLKMEERGSPETVITPQASPSVNSMWDKERLGKMENVEMIDVPVIDGTPSLEEVMAPAAGTLCVPTPASTIAINDVIVILPSGVRAEMGTHGGVSTLTLTLEPQSTPTQPTATATRRRLFHATSAPRLAKPILTIAILAVAALLCGPGRAAGPVAAPNVKERTASPTAAWRRALRPSMHPLELSPALNPSLPLVRALAPNPAQRAVLVTAASIAVAAAPHTIGLLAMRSGAQRAIAPVLAQHAPAVLSAAGTMAHGARAAYLRRVPKMALRAVAAAGSSRALPSVLAALRKLPRLAGALSAPPLPPAPQLLVKLLPPGIFKGLGVGIVGLGLALV